MVLFWCGQKSVNLILAVLSAQAVELPVVNAEMIVLRAVLAEGIAPLTPPQKDGNGR